MLFFKSSSNFRNLRKKGFNCFDLKLLYFEIFKEEKYVLLFKIDQNIFKRFW